MLNMSLENCILQTCPGMERKACSLTVDFAFVLLLVIITNIELPHNEYS